MSYTTRNMHCFSCLRPLTIPLLCGFLAACGDRSESGATTPAVPGPARDTAQVFLLKTDTISKSVDLPSELLPYLQTDLFAKVQGYVQEMKVDIGDRVSKGQTLAVIEAPEVKTQVSASEAALQSARAKYTASEDKYRRLSEASQSASPGIVAPVDLIASRDQMLADSSAYEAARQQAKAYKEVSGYLYIAAPFNGVVTARKADPGALVNANSMLLTVQDNHVLRLRVAVPELYVAAAAGHSNLSFSVDAYPEQRFTGVLTRKTETIDPATRTELWEFDVDNGKHLLKAGTFVSARLKLERNAPSFVVPATAVATTLERKFIIRVKGGKAEWVDVRQGLTTDAGIEIFSDLHQGDTLLLKASDERKPGSEAYWKLSR